MSSSHTNLKHAATEPAHLATRGERAPGTRRGAAGRAAALRRAPSDSDCSGETGSLSADSGDKPPSTVRAAPPPVARGNTKRSRRRGSEWEVLEGLKDGQRFEKRPEVFNGYLHKKRKWPLKGWHKRYFVVDGGILVYARGPSDVARGRLHGSVDVGLSVISAKQRRRRIDIDADEFIYHLRAKTPELFRAWLNVLKTHRLYRQHLLTFGVRETAPRINAPSDDFPTAESVSRFAISNSSDESVSTVSLSSDDSPFSSNLDITLSENKTTYSLEDAIQNIDYFDNLQTTLCEPNAKVKYVKLINSNPSLCESNLRNTTIQRVCFESCSLESVYREISKSTRHNFGHEIPVYCLENFRTLKHNNTRLNKDEGTSNPTFPKRGDNISASKGKRVCVLFDLNGKILNNRSSSGLIIENDAMRTSRKCIDLPASRTHDIEQPLDGNESDCFLTTKYIQKTEHGTSIYMCDKKTEIHRKAKKNGKVTHEEYFSKYDELLQTIQEIMNNLYKDSKDRTKLISSIEIIASDVKKIAEQLECVIGERNKMSDVRDDDLKNELANLNLSKELSNRNAAVRKIVNQLFNKLSSENAYKTADEDLFTNKSIDSQSTNSFINRIPFKLNIDENTAIVKNNDEKGIITLHQAILIGEVKKHSVNFNKELSSKLDDNIISEEFLNSYIYIPGKSSKTHNTSQTLNCRQLDDKYDFSSIENGGLENFTSPDTFLSLSDVNFLPDDRTYDSRKNASLRLTTSSNLISNKSNPNLNDSNYERIDSKYILMQQKKVTHLADDELSLHKYARNLPENIDTTKQESETGIFERHSSTEGLDSKMAFSKNLPTSEINCTLTKSISAIPSYETKGTSYHRTISDMILKIFHAKSVMAILSHENQYTSVSDFFNDKLALKTNEKFEPEITKKSELFVNRNKINCDYEIVIDLTHLIPLVFEGLENYKHKTNKSLNLKTVPSTSDRYTSTATIKAILSSLQVGKIPSKLKKPLDSRNLPILENNISNYYVKTAIERKDEIISKIVAMLPPIPRFSLQFGTKKNMKIKNKRYFHTRKTYFNLMKTGNWLGKSVPIEDGSQSEPNLSSGLESPTSGAVRGPQAGFVSGTPGGRLGSWVIESGGSLESVSRELGQAQLSVQQLQRLLEALELQQQAHHDTDVSLDGASPSVKKDRRKFGLRKKKSQSSKCGSVDLQLPHQLDGSLSHSALSALTAPPSPGGGASSVPGSAASLPIACAAARPQSLPGTESLGAAMTGPASLTSLTPDHQIREDFTVLAKDLVSSLKSIVGTLCAERARAVDSEAPAGGGGGGGGGGGAALAALRNNLSTALHQNSELKSRLARIHDASDLAELSLGPVSDLVSRQLFQASLSYSSSCVSASEFFDAEEHDDDDDDEGLKEPTLLAGDVEGGVIELEGDTSSEAGSLSSEEGSASSDNSDAALLNAESNAMTLNDLGGESAGTGWVRRTRLPSPRPTPGGPSLWNLLYKNIGKDLSQVSMPVSINEPLNMLQRLCEELEYSELLDTASECRSDTERMSLMAAFAVSAYASAAHRAASKPFNPLLGETYECVREDRGFRFIAEQVSHHPPVSVCHAESPRWTFWQEARIKTKFWGKSMEFQPAGRVHVMFHATGDHYSWNKVTTCVHNLFGGQRWVDQYGDMHICSDTNLTCKLNFIKASSWSATRHEVRGAVTGASGARPLRLAGRWSEALYAGDPPAARCLWRPGAMPPEHELYYGFTRFAMELNEMEPGMRGTLPHTDTRLRPDQRALEEGDVDAAERFKSQLEQAQRERRRDFPNHTARWFRKTSSASGEEEWVYGGDYWRAREAGFPGEAAARIW